MLRQSYRTGYRLGARGHIIISHLVELNGMGDRINNNLTNLVSSQLSSSSHLLLVTSQQGLFQPWYYNASELIFYIKNIIEYLKHFSPLEIALGFPDGEIIELVEFVLIHECQKQLLVQGSNLAAKSLNKIVEFCKKFDTADAIFHKNGDTTHPNKNSRGPVQVTNQPP